MKKMRRKMPKKTKTSQRPNRLLSSPPPSLQKRKKRTILTSTPTSKETLPMKVPSYMAKYQCLTQSQTSLGKTMRMVEKVRMKTREIFR
jgi:hypothetical protein